MAQVTITEKQARNCIVRFYKNYLIAHKRKNWVDINQAYGQMKTWQSIFDEMRGDKNVLDAELEKAKALIEKDE
jgi:hypothetical protein